MDRLIRELLDTLGERGVTLDRLDFAGVPLRLADERGMFSLEEMPANRIHTPVAVITDGIGMLRERRGRNSTRLLEELCRWPRLAIFVFGTHGPSELHAWTGETIPVYPGEALIPWLSGRALLGPSRIEPRQLQMWAAACAVAPQFVSDDDALELRSVLGLDAVSPESLELLRSDEDGSRLRWSLRDRARLIEWMRVTNPGGFALAVGWWRVRYQEATENSPLDDPARFDAATLDLWTTSSRVIPSVARRLVGAVMPAGRPLAYMAPSDVAVGDPRATHLPWRWLDTTDPLARARLRAVGLAEGLGGLEEPARLPSLNVVVPAVAGTLSLLTGTLLLLGQPTTVMRSVPCIDRARDIDGQLAIVWRCGTREARRPTHPEWPRRSSVSIFSEPRSPDAAQLALALLDRGAADAVWWHALEPGAEQRIAVLVDARPCPTAASACVRTVDLRGLTAALGPNVVPIAVAWPEIEDGSGWMMGEPEAFDDDPRVSELRDAAPKPDAVFASTLDATPPLQDLGLDDGSDARSADTPATLVTRDGSIAVDAGLVAPLPRGAERAAGRPLDIPSGDADGGAPATHDAGDDSRVDAHASPLDLCRKTDEQGRDTPCRPALVRRSGGEVRLSGSPNEPLVQLAPYWLSATEITEAQWSRVMEAPRLTFRTGAAYPARGITWLAAVEFCNRLSALEGYTSAYEIQGRRVTWNHDADGYRLPTEAEWVKAAQSVAASANGDLDAIAWSNADNLVEPMPAASGPSRAGLFGMLGNVSEMMWDSYAGSDSVRAVRGGSFAQSPSRLDPSLRQPIEVHVDARDVGFRLARTIHSGD